VQNQSFGAPVKSLEDLHTLLHAHADILDFGIRVDGKAVLFTDLLDILSGFDHIQLYALDRLHSQDNILSDGEGGHQHEVLVDHSDPGFDGLLGVIQHHRLAMDQNLSACRRKHAVELIHQGTFSCAVL